MERKQRSVDGFVPRNSSLAPKKLRAPVLVRPELGAAKPKPSKIDEDANALKRDLKDSLDNISEDFTDLETTDANPKTLRKDKKAEKWQKKLAKKNKKRAKKGKKPLTLKQFKKKKLVHKIILVIVAAIIAIGGWYAYSFLKSFGNIFEGNIFDVLVKEKLREDENGRTNILVFGPAPEDWDGANLTDSIMVVSINQTDNSAYIVSLPRDLWVKRSCWGGYQSSGKLNETYLCGMEDSTAQDPRLIERDGAKALAKTAETVTGLDIQYYVKASWQAVIDGVDSLGGIDFTVESDDPRGIYDVNTGIKYANGETVHMNGVDALTIARARNSEGGYGLSGSNFDREKNQQRVIEAMLTKAMSGGTLANPAKVLGIMDALGDNILTDFSTSEIRTIADVAQGISSQGMVPLPLSDPENGVNLVTTDNINGASVVVPTAGTFDYSEIIKYLRKAMTTEAWEKEEAVVEVWNGSGVAGLGASKADELEVLGFIIGELKTAPDIEDYGSVAVYKLNGDNPATEKKLIEKYRLNSISDLPATLATYTEYNSDFLVIFGG